MKTAFCRLMILAGILTFLLLTAAPLPAQVQPAPLPPEIESTEFNMIRVRDAATAEITYGIHASIEGMAVRRVTLVTPLSKTFVLFDTAIPMSGIRLALDTEATKMSEAFFTTNFPDGQYKTQVTFADSSTQTLPLNVLKQWPDFPTVLYPASGATNVPNAPLIQWTRTNGAYGYAVSFSAANYFYDVSRYDVPWNKTSVLFPEGTLLEGDTYEMLLEAGNDRCRSVTRVSFRAAQTTLGPALISRIPDNYLLGVMKMGSEGYQIHGEVQPKASGYSRFEVVFPQSAGSVTVFESPLASNPYQVWACMDLSVPVEVTGAYTVKLRRDGGSNSQVQVSTPSQYPGEPVILAPTSGQGVPPGYLAKWSIGTGAAPNAILREVDLDKWRVDSFVEPSVMQAAIPAFPPTRGSSEEAELMLMHLRFQSSGNATGFLGAATKTKFEIHYPTRADGGAWALYP